ncbi:MAG TPA: iron uptake porin, partial [Stenomitos sp.]
MKLQWSIVAGMALYLGGGALPAIAAQPPLQEKSDTPQGQDVAPSAVTPLLSAIESEQVGQVTSVSQLSDVQPTDWAFQALQSLVERYGCIAGYPDGTFRGNRAATRYELAAALNACLDQISDRFATKEDLETVKALQEEFKAELATLKGRVDGLEARTATLEAQQFSTTTKLQGEAIFSGIAAGGGSPQASDPNPTASYRVRLNLVTSFTGKDTLITGLQAFGYQGGLLGGTGLQNALFPGSALNSGSANVS